MPFLLVKPRHSILTIGLNRAAFGMGIGEFGCASGTPAPILRPNI